MIKSLLSILLQPNFRGYLQSLPEHRRMKIKFTPRLIFWQIKFLLFVATWKEMQSVEDCISLYVTDFQSQTFYDTIF